MQGNVIIKLFEIREQASKMNALLAIVILFFVGIYVQIYKPNFLKGTHMSRFRGDLIFLVILFIILIGLVGGK